MSTNDLIVKAFINETSEMLSELEGFLLDLEDNPEDKETLNAVFRVMHTVKGSSGMAGFEVIYKFAHQVEETLDNVRKGVVSFSEAVANKTLEARDIILELIHNGEEVTPDLQAKMDAVHDFFSNPGDSSQSAQPAPTQSENKSETAPVGNKLNRFEIDFRPNPGIFLSGSDPLHLVHELELLGSVVVKAKMDNVPPLNHLKAEQNYVYWHCILDTEKQISAVKDVFIFVESDSTLEIKEVQIDTAVQASVSEVAVSSQQEAKSVEQPEVKAAAPAEGEVVEAKDVAQAKEPSDQVNSDDKKKAANTIGDIIRVDADKLDKFVDLVGELVTIQAQLEQTSRKVNDLELENISENFQRLMEELRDSALGLRMVPIGSTFSKFRRIVRDISNQLGKKVSFETEGGDTELDKTVIDRLNDSLVHIIRNSLDHGIEVPEQRLASSKPEEAKLTISARHAGGDVVIEIRDDGKGISKKRVLEKAISQGLVSADEKLSDDDIFKLLFVNGLSTAQEVSRISGRGVGMDVVKKQIEDLSGTVSIYSEEGKYTKTILTIPLTLAIIDGLLVKIDKDFYVVPLSSVESCLEKADALKTVKTEDDNKVRKLVHYRGHFLPYIPMRDFLEYDTPAPKREQIVVIQMENNFYGMVVDEVIGDHQTVIKNLGKAFKNLKGFSGATILGNGQIALILNVGLIPHLYEKLSKKAGNE
ncbi:MAG: chemotaxis protein CheA [Spirochaetales bacterium]|nr:chemotaxis protein CheA [Spirochaetales bacterium]